jgi:4a-hydroxytetrahydrobiopterin dehydratase
MTSACKISNKAMLRDEADSQLSQLESWILESENNILKLRKSYKFKNFQSALDFANKVGGLAEDKGHHPKIDIEWGKTTLTWYTHSNGGLNKIDFNLAKLCDSITQ